VLTIAEASGGNLLALIATAAAGLATLLIGLSATRIRASAFKVSFGDDTGAVEAGETRGIPNDERGFALLREYHAQGLAQSKISFWFSIAFASLGFVLIAATVVTSVVSQDEGVTAANVVALIAGAIVEAVSGLFFVQSNRARELMVEFFDRLRQDHGRDRALEIAAEVPDEHIRSRLQATLSLSLAGASVPDQVMHVILDAAAQPLPPGRIVTSDGDGAATP
jgi:TRADD-N domain-containing protein